MEKHSINRLISDARHYASGRDHTLGDFDVEDVGNGHYRAYAQCQDCGKGVLVQTNPALNSIDMAGEAIAINCRVHAHRQAYNQLG